MALEGPIRRTSCSARARGHREVTRPPGDRDGGQSTACCPCAPSPDKRTARGGRGDSPAHVPRRGAHVCERRRTEPAQTSVARGPANPGAPRWPDARAARQGPPPEQQVPGARPAAAPLRAHSEPPCALKAEPASGRACLSLVPAAARPRGGRAQSSHAGPLLAAHVHALARAQTGPRARPGTGGHDAPPTTGPQCPPHTARRPRRAPAPGQNCLGRRPGLGSAVLFSLRTVTAKTLPVPFVRGAPGTSMPASTASVLPAAVPCR